MKKRFNQKYIYAAIAVAIFLSAILISSYTLGELVVVETEWIGSNATKTSVRLSSASFSLLTGELKVSHLTVGNPRGYYAHNAVRAKKIYANTRLTSFLRDARVVDKMIISGVVLYYEESKHGNNLELLRDRLHAYFNGSGGKHKGKHKYLIKDVTIDGLTVHWAPQILGGKFITLEIPHLHYAALGSGAGVPVDVIVQDVLNRVIQSAAGKIAGDGQKILGTMTKEGGKAIETLEHLFHH